MLELWSLWGPLVLITLLVGASVWRMAVGRFPHPADLASLWITYYTIPLAVLAAVVGDDFGVVFLHPAAANPEIETRCIQYALLSIVCLQVGKWVARKSARPPTRLQFPLDVRDSPKINVVILLLLGMIALGIYMFGVDVFFSGYAIDAKQDTDNPGRALVYMAIELIGLTMAYAYLVSKANHRRVGLAVSLFAVAILMTIAALRGKRLEVVSAMVSVGVLMLGTNRLFRSVSGRFLFVGLLALGMTTVGLFRLGNSLDIAMMGFNFVAEGLFAGHALPGIIEKLDTYQFSYEYGKRVIFGLLAFVPRFIWPSKDEMLYDGDRALDSVRPLGASTILAEIVLQGGSTAVIIWFGTLGYLFERLYRSLDNFDNDMRERRVSAGTVGYLVSVTIFIPHWRDGVVPCIKLALQCSVFFYALAGISWRVPLKWGAIRRRRQILPAA